MKIESSKIELIHEYSLKIEADFLFYA